MMRVVVSSFVFMTRIYDQYPADQAPLLQYNTHEKRTGYWFITAHRRQC